MSRVAIAVVAALAAIPSLAAAAGDGCRQGFVWREAFPGDHVCVVPEVRSQARSDNAQAYSRINQVNHDYGPDTCRGGYVWREASRADHVCVTPDVRAQARADNAAAGSRVSGGGGGQVGDGSFVGGPRVQDASCCPSYLLVCPGGRHWCR